MDRHEIPSISYESLDLSVEQRALFDRFAQILVEKNAQVNLTAITDLKEIREKHFADSLAVRLWAGFEEAAESGRILDLGTGGGFPGIPVKIAHPQADMTLLDATKKKLTAVSEMAEALELHGVCTLWARAEEAGRDPEQREAYDLVLSRAVAYLPSLIECAVPFLKEDGVFIAYKQGACEDELNAAGHALEELKASVEEVIAYNLAGEERKLIVIRKNGSTPDKYPRRAGVPVKNPL